MSSPAVAGDEEPPPDYLAATDVLPGSCLPAEVLYGQVVDCRFPLAREGELDPWGGPHVADQSLVFDDENDDQADCRVTGTELVCEGVSAYDGFSSSTVRAVISGESSAVTAAFAASDWIDHGVNITSRHGEEPFVFEGTSLGAWLDSTITAGQVFASITSRDGSESVATVPLGPVGPNTVESIDIDLGGIGPGRYRVTPCVGAGADSCEPIPGGQVFQVGTMDLVEVVPGWNRRDADRINIVFAPSGFDSVEDALDMARALITWDGPMPLGYDGEPVSPDSPPELIALIEFGPFAIEPIASHRDLFNLWMLDDLVADPRALVHSAPPLGFGPPVPELGMADVSVTTLHLNQIGRLGRSEAGWPSFTSPDGPTTVDRAGLEFGGVFIALPREWPLDEASTLAHEWGHALFDLRDEYIDSTRGATHGYPNCAPDEATAEEWWGGMLGEVDPFVYRYVAALERHLVWVDPFLTDRIEVGYEVGGCYSDGSDAVRPTADSIMNSGMPVFGSVNRYRVEQILSLWTGRVPLTTASELSVTCDTVDPDRPSAVCRATIVPMVDPPPEGLVLTLEGGNSSACSTESGGGEESIVLACRTLPLAGPGPWVVTVGTPTGSVIVTTAIAGPPSTTTTTIAGPPEEGTPAAPLWPLGAGAAVLVVLGVVAAIRRVRR